MRFPHFLRSALLVLLATGALAAPQHPVNDAAVAAANGRGAVTRYYTMNAHVRPFLMWIKREDVGGARVSWRGTPGGDAQYELLIGSDPDRAPWAINRWGFIAEHTFGDTTHQTGVMTETDDKSIDAARTNAAAMGATHAFRSIRSTVRAREATTSTRRVLLDKNLTYRDYASLLARLPAVAGTDEKSLRLAPGTAPGVLTALKAVIHDSVGQWRQGNRVGASLPARAFVHNGKLFDMSLKRASLVKNAVVAGRSFGSAIEAVLAIRTVATGAMTEFRMLYAVDGDEAETPLRIVYRPRWWMEIELVLVDPAGAKNRFAMRTDGED